MGAEFSAERQTIAAKWLNCSQLNKCSNRISLTVCTSLSVCPSLFFLLVFQAGLHVCDPKNNSFQQVLFFFSFSSSSSSSSLRISRECRLAQLSFTERTRNVLRRSASDRLRLNAGTIDFRGRSIKFPSGRSKKLESPCNANFCFCILISGHARCFASAKNHEPVILTILVERDWLSNLVIVATNIQR